MQKEHPVENSFRQIKIRYAKYKFAERSYNFLMQLPMQLIFNELIILRYSYLLDDCNYFVVTCSAVDKVLNAYYVKLLAPPTIIHPLYSKKNKNGTVH